MSSGDYAPVAGSLDDSDLANTEAASPRRLDNARTRRTPLPKLAMLAFCGIRSSEPFLFFVLFPFVNEMLVEYGISTDEKSTGYRAGMLEAALAFGNLSTMMLCVHLADTYGRRSMMLWPTLASACVGSLLGFPRSYWILLALRMLLGAMNGQAGVSKNYLAELVDESNQAAAFSLMSLAWQVGWCVAAIAGGYLSHAERAFPSLTDWPLVRDHPYALPFIAVAVPPMLSVVLGYFALQETLRPGTANAKTAAALKEEAPPAGGHFFGWTPNMWKTLRLWCIGVVINNSFQATLPLLVFAPVHAGGLGLGSRAIGLWYGIRALLIIAVELPIYPRVHRRFGHAVIFRAQISMYPLVFSLIPVISLVRWWRYDPASEAKVDAVTLVLVGILLCLELLGQTMFISLDLLCTNASADPALQPKYNGFVEFCSKLFQTFAVWFAAWLFAFSAESQILGGYLVWLILFSGSLAGARMVYVHQEEKGWRSRADSGVAGEYESATPLTPYHDQTGRPAEEH